MCPDCIRLKRIIKELQGRNEQLRMIIKDMGAPIDFDDERVVFDEGVPLISEDK